MSNAPGLQLLVTLVVTWLNPCQSHQHGCREEHPHVYSYLCDYLRSRLLPDSRHGLEVLHLLVEVLLTYFPHTWQSFGILGAKQFKLFPAHAYQLGDHLGDHTRERLTQHILAPLVLDTIVDMPQKGVRVCNSSWLLLNNIPVSLRVDIRHVVAQPDVATLQNRVAHFIS